MVNTVNTSIVIVSFWIDNLDGAFYFPFNTIIKINIKHGMLV